MGIVDISRYKLPGWWSKMCLFNRDLYHPNSKMIYFDLDTIITGDLGPLIDLEVDFGICQNFTQLRGNKTWPCRYGSCVMALEPEFGHSIWEMFWIQAEYMMQTCARGGDQRAIELLCSSAVFLQDRLPANFFHHYKDFTNSQPPGSVVAVFGGDSKPENCNIPWLLENWK